MNLADCRKLAHSLLVAPDLVSLVTVGGRRWITDQYALVDVAAIRVEPVFAGLDDGAYDLAASRPPKPDPERTPVSARAAGQLLDKFAAKTYTPLTVTGWMVDGPARVLCAGEQVVLADEKAMSGWQRTPQTVEIGDAGLPLRFTAGDRLLGYLMPIRRRGGLPPMPWRAEAVPA